MTPTYVIPPLLGIPLIGLALVRCNDPWKALVLRSSLGGFASLLYATYGAVDVAVTEALVGTLLSTLLYTVAIKSTTTFRLLQQPQASMGPEQEQRLKQLLALVGLRLEVMAVAPASETGDLHAVFIRDRENQPTVLLRHRSLLAELTARDAQAVREMNLLFDPSFASR